MFALARRRGKAQEIRCYREDAPATSEQPYRMLADRRSSPIGMSMTRQARSLVRLFSNFGRSTTSTDVAREVTSTLNQTHPARHPSAPAANVTCAPYNCEVNG